MCGIIGCCSAKNAIPVIEEGLRRLEYRGYDSSGTAVVSDGKLKVVKAVGRVEKLTAKTAEMTGNTAIGHTRWATHGTPNEKNCHPHLSQNGQIAVVHNGIIENYAQIRDFLSERGFSFYSQTDTETAVKLVEYYYTGCFERAVIKAARRLKGSFALAFVHAGEEKIYAIRRENPLIIGLGKSANYIASDMPALASFTDKFILPDNDELSVISSDCVTIFNSNLEKTEKEVKRVDLSGRISDKGDLKHFMLKEIYEQPSAIRDTLSAYIKDGSIVLPLDAPQKLTVIACGSSYHAGLMGKYFIEKVARIPVAVELGSEYRYKTPLPGQGEVLAISQSGETADTIAAVRQAKRQANPCFSVVNVPESSLARLTTPIYTHAGAEIAVATTKGFSTQVVITYLIALKAASENLSLPAQKNLDPFSEKNISADLSEKTDYIGSSTYTEQKTADIAEKAASHEQKNAPLVQKDEIEYLIGELTGLADKISEALRKTDEIKKVAARFFTSPFMFFVGRGDDYAAAMEGALKLKEISYIHAEAYAAGELKHGTISLIEEGTPVIALVNLPEQADKMLSNIIEIKSRGGVVITFSCLTDEKLRAQSDYFIPVPRSPYASLLSVIELQLFAYYTALAKGCDIDKPRNLAKSVTVE